MTSVVNFNGRDDCVYVTDQIVEDFLLSLSTNQYSERSKCGQIKTDTGTQLA
jgi:hypothetical protein